MSGQQRISVTFSNSVSPKIARVDAQEIPTAGKIRGDLEQWAKLLETGASAYAFTPDGRLLPITPKEALQELRYTPEGGYDLAPLQAKLQRLPNGEPFDRGLKLAVVSPEGDKLMRQILDDAKEKDGKLFTSPYGQIHLEDDPLTTFKDLAQDSSAVYLFAPQFLLEDMVTQRDTAKLPPEPRGFDGEQRIRAGFTNPAFKRIDAQLKQRYGADLEGALLDLVRRRRQGLSTYLFNQGSLVPISPEDMKTVVDAGGRLDVTALRRKVQALPHAGNFGQSMNDYQLVAVSPKGDALMQQMMAHGEKLEAKGLRNPYFHVTMQNDPTIELDQLVDDNKAALLFYPVADVEELFYREQDKNK